MFSLSASGRRVEVDDHRALPLDVPDFVDGFALSCFRFLPHVAVVPSGFFGGLGAVCEPKNDFNPA